ncbi:response regulator [Salinispirillum sp. LH 10-3-1]|uniref:Response regulator n=1 Tax=Salinispirillum sp. LH 10-3-1 TaxID=2952525 RepID=A0AB38YIL8_9GAMM
MIKTLTPGEIARLCDVHQRTVSRWIASGKLKGHQLPGRGDYRVLESDFLTFVESHHLPVDLPNTPTNTILIIDDEAAVRRALGRLFIQDGYKVIEAEDSFTAGALLERDQPALITLDLMMPGIRIEHVFEFLRSNERNIPIVVISAAPPNLLDEAKRMGALEVVSKPFQNDELLQIIARTMRNARPNRRL